MSMTILWSLETLSKDDVWTRKETLTIRVRNLFLGAACDSKYVWQVLGAADANLTHGSPFEEILHHLPAVRNLNVCGICTVIVFA